MGEVNLINALPLPAGLLTIDTVWTVVKWMVVLGLALYCLFAAVIIKQVAIMSETLEDPANGAVRFLAWGHLLFAVGLTLLVIVVV